MAFPPVSAISLRTDDHDTRIHLLMRGPGIAPGSTFPYLGTQVDLAPTWLGLAGLPKPPTMDGRSIAPLLLEADAPGLPAQTKAHVVALAPHGQKAFASTWRDSVFIEYYFNSPNTKCRDYPTEDSHNNFIGVRHLAGSEFGDTSYTEYQTGNQADAETNGIQFDNVDFIEYFNLTADNWQMKNLWHDSGTTAAQEKLHAILHKWYKCKGDECP